MSTRKSTRAASRAGSRAPSPAISTADIPATPRRSVRRPPSNSALPAVGARQSTAYGTNTTAQPARDGAPPMNNLISDVLHEQLGDNLVGNPPGRRFRSSVRSATPSVVGGAENSFSHEDHMFQNAKVDSSVISDNSPFINNNKDDGMPPIDEGLESDEDEPCPDPESVDDLNARAEKDYLRDLARQRVDAARQLRGEAYLNYIERAKDWLEKAWSTFLKYLFPIGVGLAILLLLPLLFSGRVRDFKTNLGRFVPYSVSHPLDAFNPSDVQVVNRRLNDLEYKVSRLSSRPSDIDPKALTTIQDMLPDFLVVKKDKYGNTVIPADFWHALQDKIRSDDTLVQESTGQSSSHDVHSVRQKDLDKEVKKLWEKYVKSNNAQVGNLQDEDLVHKFPELLKQNHIASKSEVMDLIRQNWEDNRVEVRTEMSDLKKKLEQATRQISKLQRDFKDEAKVLANDVMKKFISNGQLDALAAANLKSNVNWGLTRVNFFSRGTGAIVNPYLTAPSYVFPAHDVYIWEKAARFVAGNPILPPNTADVALMKWEEHGDCWCSSVRGDDGDGPTLGVIMGSNIYPDQVVVEHIKPTAALEPGAAPREMELLAYIPDPNLYEATSAMATSIFGEFPQRLDNYVPIARWTYDLEDSQNIQAFPVQMDMKALGAHTNRLIIRSKNNWGGKDGKEVEYTCLYRVRVHGDPVATPGLS